jgi:mevalonate kinase
MPIIREIRYACRHAVQFLPQRTDQRKKLRNLGAAKVSCAGERTDSSGLRLDYHPYLGKLTISCVWPNCNFESSRLESQEYELNKRVEISAPGKLMLFGEHAVIYNRPCIVTAVDQRMRVSAELTESKSLRIEAPDVGVKEYTEPIGRDANPGLPKGARFMVTAVRNFYDYYGMGSGVTIRTKSEFPSEFGFGSSSAVTTAVLKALSELFGIEISNKQLFELSYKTVLDVQGLGSGFDLAAAIWGGTIYFRSGGSEIAPLDVDNLPLTVGYTGIKADTPTLVRHVGDFYLRHGNLANRIFDTMSDIVEQARDSLEDLDVGNLGYLMNINQGLLDSLGVNSLELSMLIYGARQAGAIGAKLSGAGGGDCMIALSLDQHKEVVEQAIERMGGKVLKVKTGALGVHSEQNSGTW